VTYNLDLSSAVLGPIAQRMRFSLYPFVFNPYMKDVNASVRVVAGRPMDK